MRQLIVIILVGFCLSANAQGNISFRSVDEAFIYADAHSSVFKNATQENILSKYQTLAAKLATWNLKSDANFSATDNTKLGTTFIPAEIFGEPTGNLDSKNSAIVFETFQQLAHELGQTIIVVTHDNDFAEKSDRVIEMIDGTIPGK